MTRPKNLPDWVPFTPKEQRRSERDARYAADKEARDERKKHIIEEQRRILRRKGQ